MKKKLISAWLCLVLFALGCAYADITYTLRLSTTNITLSPGESRTVTWSVEPVNLVQHVITWESDNPYVASVDQRGKITARAAGSTYVRATLETGVQRRVTVNVSGNAVTELKLDRNTLELEVGHSATLIHTINLSADDKRVRWKSDDPSVATVDQNGRVTAVGGGVTTVTVMSVNGKTATCEVYVPSDVKSVRLSPKTLEIGVGRQYLVDTEVLPVNARDRSLTWESSDPDIASVTNSGLVTGVSEGECKIGARSVNGLYDVIDVKVTLLPESLMIDPGRLVLSREERTASLSVSALPENADISDLKWISSDEKVATVESGFVTAQGYGAAVISVESRGGASASVEVYVSEVPTSVRFAQSLYLLPLGGEDAQVYPIFTPYDSVSKGYTISVEDESIAVIDQNNLLHAKAIGTTHLTLRSEEGLECTSEIRVYEDVKSLYLSADNVTIGQYQTYKPYIYSETGREFTGRLEVEIADESVCAYTGEELYARLPGTTLVTFTHSGTLAACALTLTVLPADDYSTRVIALTFDNGPGEYTGDILKVLDKYNVRATFFLLGRSIESYPDAAKLFADTAHELGNHTYDNSSVSSGSIASTAGALEKTDRLAERWTGRELTLLRAPDALLPDSLLSSFLDTRRFVGRGLDMGDLSDSATPESHSACALEKVYNTCILTFHDAGPATAEALDLLLPELLLRGYRFLTVSELIEYTGFEEGIFSTKPS